MEIMSVGQTDMYLKLATQTNSISSNLNSQKGEDFEKTINKVFVEQLTNTLLSGSLFGGNSEYSHLVKDAMSDILTEQFKVIDTSEIGEKHDK